MSEFMLDILRVIYHEDILRQINGGDLSICLTYNALKGKLLFPVTTLDISLQSGLNKDMSMVDKFSFLITL